MSSPILPALSLVARSDAWDVDLPILEFTGKNAISTLFEYVIIVQSIEPITALGAKVNVAGMIADEEILLEGHISQLDMYLKDGLQYYKITITPALHALAFGAKHRIFTNQTILEIIDSILEIYKIKSVNLSSQQLTKKVYCVQYAQTDLEFIESLLAEVGMLYTFKCDQNGAQFVIFDHYNDLKLISAETYSIKSINSSFDSYLITNIAVRQRYTPMGYHASYTDFQKMGQPKTMKSDAEGDKNNHFFQSDNLLHYHYLGHLDISNNEVTADTLNVQMNYHKMQAKFVEMTVQRYIAPGTAFKVRWSEIESIDYVAVSTEHYYASKQTTQSDKTYTVVIAVEADVTIVAKQHPKPVIPGVHRGIVVCPKDPPPPPANSKQPAPPPRETYTDQWGRVCVRFFWSEEYINDEPGNTNTCWVRPTYAGATNNGFYYIPRKGDEVLVAFEEGDPERPYLINALYNSQNTIPYNPEKADINFWRMSKTGNAKEFNEIQFNADAQKSAITVTACQDYICNVTQDWTETIANGNYMRTHTQGNYTHIMDKGNYAYMNKQGNYTSTLTKGDLSTSVLAGTNTLKVSDGYTVDVGSRSMAIGGSDTATINGGETRTVSGGRTVDISGGDSLKVTGGGCTIKIEGGALELSSDTEISLKAPMVSIDALKFSILSMLGKWTNTGAMTIKSGDINISGAAINMQAAAEFSIDAAAAIDITAGAAMELDAAAELSLSAAAAVSVEAASMDIAAAMVTVE